MSSKYWIVHSQNKLFVKKSQNKLFRIKYLLQYKKKLGI